EGYEYGSFHFLEPSFLHNYTDSTYWGTNWGRNVLGFTINHLVEDTAVHVTEVYSRIREPF
ncbi:hypothetical protein ABNE52_20060, partial [Paenibacillus larvae]